MQIKRQNLKGKRIMDPETFLSQAVICRCCGRCNCQTAIKITFKNPHIDKAATTTGIFQTTIMGKLQLKGGRFPIPQEEIQDIVFL